MSQLPERELNVTWLFPLGGGRWAGLAVGRMVGLRDRPQHVLDFIDLIWKAIYGDVLR